MNTKRFLLSAFLCLTPLVENANGVELGAGSTPADRGYDRRKELDVRFYGPNNIFPNRGSFTDEVGSSLDRHAAGSFWDRGYKVGSGLSDEVSTGFSDDVYTGFSDEMSIRFDLSMTMKEFIIDVLKKIIDEEMPGFKSLIGIDLSDYSIIFQGVNFDSALTFNAANEILTRMGKPMIESGGLVNILKITREG